MGLEERVIEGVTGIVMDVTELKVREKHIQAQAQEKRRLVANEAAAKEASRLKSQFLANVSREPYRDETCHLDLTLTRCLTRSEHRSAG
jgi:hypothetical protein